MKTKHTKRAKNPDTPEFTSKYYVTNGKMLPEVIKSKELGKMTDALASMLMMLTKKYAQRPCFSGYTYKEDMISEAIANLCQNALKFNPEKSSNPFAYYTTCINSSFLQFLNVEKKHRRIRDQLLVDIGENPSFSFIEESKQTNEFTSDINDLKNQIEEAKVRMTADAIYAANKLALLDQAAVVDPEDLPEEVLEELIPNISLLEFEEE
jgi:DNA-directed RNA polymerase specialized sigma subunit